MKKFLLFALLLLFGVQSAMFAQNEGAESPVKLLRNGWTVTASSDCKPPDFVIVSPRNSHQREVQFVDAVS